MIGARDRVHGPPVSCVVPGCGCRGVSADDRVDGRPKPSRRGLQRRDRRRGRCARRRPGDDLFGIDTDRDPYTGAGRGDELLLFVNGEGATFTRWTGRGFSPDFTHHDVEAALSGTDLTFVLSWADVGARSFNFSVATLREDADLAPGFGIATYPQARTAGRHAHRAPARGPRALSRESLTTETRSSRLSPNEGGER